MANDRKFWVYIYKQPSKIRDFEDKLCLQCENLEDAKIIATLFEKAGFETNSGESTTGLGFSSSSNKDGEY